MIDESNIRKELELQGFQINETDIIYTQNILSMVNQAQDALKEFPELLKEKPITIVDKGVLVDD
jgi:hypothetical protein